MVAAEHSLLEGSQPCYCPVLRNSEFPEREDRPAAGIRRPGPHLFGIVPLPFESQAQRFDNFMPMLGSRVNQHRKEFGAGTLSNVPGTPLMIGIPVPIEKL